MTQLRALAVIDGRMAEAASRMFAENASAFKLPFAFHSDAAPAYRDIGGTLEFCGASWDYFQRLRDGGPARITLHADLTQWGTRTGADATPAPEGRGRLDVEIDFARITQQQPKFRAFVYDAGVPEQPCISALQLRLAHNGGKDADVSPIEWDPPLGPEQDWRADAIRKCIQSHSETLFWVLEKAGVLAPRVAVMAAPPAATVSTLGFDTVFATTLESVNRDLARNADRLAATFSYDAPADGFHMTGTFGSWCIVPGGSGTIVHLVIPIASGSLTAKGRLGSVETDLAGLSVTLETDLTLVPSAAAVDQKELRFAFQAGQAPGAKLATVIRVEGPPEKVSKAGELLKTYLPPCLNANAASFAYVFAVIRIAQPGVDTWLAPAQCAYCFAQPQGAAETFVALLGSSASAPIRPQDLRIDPALLGGAGSAGPDSGYLAISKNMYLTHVVVPALTRIFPGTTAGSYRVDITAHKIVNTGPFALPGVSSPNGTHTPIVRTLEITADHGALVTYLQGDCDLGLNITLHFSARSTCPVMFDKAQQSFLFQSDPHPDITSSADIPWYDYGLLLLGIPGIIIAAIEVSVLTGFEGALRSGGIRMSPAQAGGYSLRWGGMRAFQITEAGFADSFYMRGHLQ
jgi:hypothetical protein